MLKNDHSVKQDLIVYGINPLDEALKSLYPPQKIYIERSSTRYHPRREQLIARAQKLNIPCEEVKGLNRYCGNHAVHQGIAGVYDFWPFIKKELPDHHVVRRLIVLDGIEDPHNFGAAIRVCEVFGFPNILYQKDNSSGITPVAVKASAGAVFHVTLFEFPIKRALDKLETEGFAIYVLESQADYDLVSYPLQEPYVLVVGSEGWGVRPSVQRRATARLKIPMMGKVNSLNVSCALSAALALIRIKNLSYKD